MRGHFAYFEKKMLIQHFFSHNGGQTTMNQNGRVNFFECLRPKLTIFEVKASIHRLAFGTIARAHSTSFKLIKLFKIFLKYSLSKKISFFKKLVYSRK